MFTGPDATCSRRPLPNVVEYHLLELAAQLRYYFFTLGYSMAAKLLLDCRFETIAKKLDVFHRGLPILLVLPNIGRRRSLGPRGISAACPRLLREAPSSADSLP